MQTEQIITEVWRLKMCIKSANQPFAHFKLTFFQPKTISRASSSLGFILISCGQSWLFGQHNTFQNHLSAVLQTSKQKLLSAILPPFPPPFSAAFNCFAFNLQEIGPHINYESQLGFWWWKRDVREKSRGKHWAYSVQKTLQIKWVCLNGRWITG